MTSRYRKLIAGAVATVLWAGSAQAATLGGIQGSVMVNTGSGYFAATGSMQLKPGDQVMVGPGGSAHINYTDGCNQGVQPGGVVTVSPQSPCAANANNNADYPKQPGGQGQADMGGMGGGGFGSQAVVIGAVVVVGGVGLAVGLSGNGSNPPASP